MIDTKRLQGKMREQGESIISLSSKIGLSTTGLFNKIHNKKEFTASEIENVGILLKLSASEMCSIFFTQYVD